MANINFSKEDILVSSKSYAYYRTTGKLNIGCGKQQGFGMFVRFSGDSSVTLGIDLKESNCDLYKLSLEDFSNSLNRRFSLSSVIGGKFKIKSIVLNKSEVGFSVSTVHYDMLYSRNIRVTKGEKWGEVGDFFDCLEKYLSEECVFDGVTRKVFNYGQYY